MKKNLFNLCLIIMFFIFRLFLAFFRGLRINKIWNNGIRILRDAYWKSLFKSSGKNVMCGKNLIIYSPEKLTCGTNISFGDYCHIWASGEVIIGNNVMIGAFVSISSLSHDYTKHSMMETLVRKKIVIENDVWICTGVCILPGVTIGKGAVIGAGAVVNKDVDAYDIVAGVPAKPIKNRKAFLT